MHAVFVRLTLEAGRGDEAEKILHDVVVPTARQATGFQSGYWARSDDRTKGASVEVFDTEANAKAFVDSMQIVPGSPVSLDSVDIMEILASA
jgi:heme-degrading monooxygenase HmoA